MDLRPLKLWYRWVYQNKAFALCLQIADILLLRLFQELLSNLVFEDCWSCGDLVRVGGFNSVFESNAGDDLGEIIKAA